MPLTLSALHVYPVKGLKGIDLATARCTDRGFEHDRRWMVVDSDGEFLSQREHPKMATVWTEIAGGALSLSAPDEPGVEVPIDARGVPTMRVRVWDSECDAVPASAAADRFLSDYLGLACRLVYMPERSERYSSRRFAPEGRRVGFADGFAYLLATEASLADLNSRLVAKRHPAVPMNRFRPNLVISGNAPYAEDGWGEIRIGEVLLRAVKPCGRCQVTTTDQATGEVKGPEPLATLSTYRESSEFGVMFGVNLVTLKTGTVHVGDALEIA